MIVISMEEKRIVRLLSGTDDWTVLERLQIKPDGNVSRTEIRLSPEEAKALKEAL